MLSEEDFNGCIFLLQSGPGSIAAQREASLQFRQLPKRHRAARECHQTLPRSAKVIV